jgi:hypothetical protein
MTTNNTTTEGTKITTRNTDIHDNTRQPGDSRERNATDYSALSTNENDFLHHHTRWGSDGYPIMKMGTGRWAWSESFEIKGAPVVYRTRKAAAKAIEDYVDSLLARIAHSS